MTTWTGLTVLTCSIIEGSNWTRIFVVVPRSFRTIVSHGANCCCVVKDNNRDSVVTEVPWWTCFTEALSSLVLVGTVLTSDFCIWTHRTVMANWTTEIKQYNSVFLCVFFFFYQNQWFLSCNNYALDNIEFNWKLSCSKLWKVHVKSIAY